MNVNNRTKQPQSSSFRRSLSSKNIRVRPGLFEEPWWIEESHKMHKGHHRVNANPQRPRGAAISSKFLGRECSAELRLEGENHCYQSQENTGERLDLKPALRRDLVSPKPPILSLSHFSPSVPLSSPSLPLPFIPRLSPFPHYNNGSHGEMFVSSILSRRDIGDRFGSDWSGLLRGARCHIRGDRL